MDTIIARGTTDLDHLYTRYSCRLLAAATERLADYGPGSIELDEDVAQDVWLAVAAGHYPSGYQGLDGLLRLLDSAVRKAMIGRFRERASGLTRRTVDVVDLDDLADTTPVTAIPTARPLPPTVSTAVAALRALPLAG